MAPVQPVTRIQAAHSQSSLGRRCENGAPQGSYKVVLTGGGTAPLLAQPISKNQLAMAKRERVANRWRLLSKLPTTKSGETMKLHPCGDVKAGMAPLDIKVAN